MSNLTKTLLDMELSRTLKGTLSVAILTVGIIAARNLVVSLTILRIPTMIVKLQELWSPLIEPMQTLKEN